MIKFNLDIMYYNALLTKGHNGEKHVRPIQTTSFFIIGYKKSCLMHILI